MNIHNEEIDKELKAITGILRTAKECFYAAYYLYKPNTKLELEYISTSLQFNFLRHIIWRNTIIELSKLVLESRSHHYNLYKFFNKLKKGGDYSCIGIKTEKINSWLKVLDSNTSSIFKIKNLRDKAYSHTDKDKEEFISEIDISFEEINRLINGLDYIVSELYKDIQDGHINLELLFFKDGFSAIKVLAEEKKKRSDLLVQEFIEKTNKGK